MLQAGFAFNRENPESWLWLKRLNRDLGPLRPFLKAIFLYEDSDIYHGAVEYLRRACWIWKYPHNDIDKYAQI